MIKPLFINRFENKFAKDKEWRLMEEKEQRKRAAKEAAAREREELDRLHERLNWASIVKLLMEMEKNFDKCNTHKLAARHGVSIYDVKALRHWFFETTVRLKPRIKKMVRNEVKNMPHSNS